MVSKKEIQSFLDDVKQAQLINIIPTEKNRRTRLLIGLTTYDQENMIRNLLPEEYDKGPLADHDSTKRGHVWIFKHRLEQNVFYIKLKDVLIIDGKSIVICLSCHIDYL